MISNLDRSFENQHANSEASFMVKSRDQKRSKSVSFHFDKSGSFFCSDLFKEFNFFLKLKCRKMTSEGFHYFKQ